MAEEKRRGRPPGSGEDLDVPISARIHPDVAAEVEAEARASKRKRSAVVREIVTKWAERRKGRAKG